VAVISTEPESKRQPDSKVSKGGTISAVLLPALFVVAWGFALNGSKPMGAVAHEAADVSYLRWIIYFTGCVFLFSSVMHSVFAKSTAASIGWKTNGFQYEVAAASLGLGAGCLYAISHGIDAMTTVSFPIVSFLFLAGVNHVIEIVRKKNYAPNNTLILVWDFGIPISVVGLLLSIGKL
jgi:hypothetical protein